MSEKDVISEPWNSFLRELDEIAAGTVDFHCIGGFVITRKFGFARETADVDILAIRPHEQIEALLEKGAKGSELHRKYRVYLDLVTVIQYYPEDYEERLTEMFPGQLRHIHLWAPEAHDLALMKLDRNSEKDREDVKFLARMNFIQVDELQRRYEKEMRPYVALPEQRLDLNLELWLEVICEDAKPRVNSSEQNKI